MLLIAYSGADYGKETSADAVHAQHLRDRLTAIADALFLAYMVLLVVKVVYYTVQAARQSLSSGADAHKQAASQQLAGTSNAGDRGAHYFWQAMQWPCLWRGSRSVQQAGSLGRAPPERRPAQQPAQRTERQLAADHASSQADAQLGADPGCCQQREDMHPPAPAEAPAMTMTPPSPPAAPAASSTHHTSTPGSSTSTAGDIPSHTKNAKVPMQQIWHEMMACGKSLQPGMLSNELLENRMVDQLVRAYMEDEPSDVGAYAQLLQHQTRGTHPAVGPMLQRDQSILDYVDRLDAGQKCALFAELFGAEQEAVRQGYHRDVWAVWASASVAV